MLGRGRALVCLGWGQGGISNLTSIPAASLHPTAKEIQLMHRAPVVGILVLDGHSVPLPEPLEVAHDLSKSPDMQGSHQLLVVSEEQFKVPYGRRRGPQGSPREGQLLGRPQSCVCSCVRAAEALERSRGLGGVPRVSGRSTEAGLVSVEGTEDADRELRDPGILVV